MPNTVQSTSKHEDLKNEMAQALGVICKAHPEIRTLEILAVLGRVSGMCVASCFPDERDMARMIVVMNMNRAIEDHAMPGPSTAGHA